MDTITIETEIVGGMTCRRIPGFSQYVINESGEIWKHHKREIKPIKTKFYPHMDQGTTSCCMKNDKGLWQGASVTALVYKTWNEDVKANFQKGKLTYLDGNPQNLHHTNIKYEHKATNVKLTLPDVETIKKLLKLGNPMAEIARDYGISDMQVYRIKIGENWNIGRRVSKKKNYKEPPFQITDKNINRYIREKFTWERCEGIRKKFYIKRNPDNTRDNVIIGIVHGFKFTSKSVMSITMIKKTCLNLNRHFFPSLNMALT